MTYTVYCHTNKINNKKYIGITSQSVYDRWQNGKHYSRHARFYADILKYGWDNFFHEILYTGITRESAEQIEKELILNLDLLNPDKGYNQRKGGRSISSPSDKTRAKLSALNKGENNPFYSRKHSNDSKLIMSERKPKKAVICVETQVLYKSTRDAERQTKVDHSDIIKVCKGVKATAGGFHWKYKEVIS